MSAKTSAASLDMREFVRFLVIGGSGALAFIALSTAALDLTQLSVPVVSIGCHAVLIPIMFWAQRSLTFESRGAYRDEFLKYAVLQIACISASAFLFDQFASVAPGERLFTACVFAAISATSAILSFLVCRFAIFSRGAAKSLSSS